jgi:membrane dipeptidase
MKALVACYLSFLCVGVVSLSCGDTQGNSDTRAMRIHNEVLTVDTHIDWPSHQLRSPEFDPGVRHDPAKRESGQWDLVRMKEGGLDGVFMSIFTSQGPRTEEGHAQAKEHALKLIEITKKMVADYANRARGEAGDLHGDGERLSNREGS